MNTTMKHTLYQALLLVLLAAHPVAAKDLHVSVNGNDQNDGSASKPCKTISAAANLAQPGDVITVHAGLYRERVSPPRGGESDTKRIVYQAAKGEKVEIKGSEVVKNWEKVQDDVWKVVIPNTFFGGFNPYSDLTRVTANLCHDNGFVTAGGVDGDDIHCEVNHGPYLIDNNLLLTPQALQIRSQGGAYVHNLIAGRVEVNSFDSRMTPFHKAHSTEVAGLRDNPCGDVRFHNNVFVQPADLGSYDETRLPVSMDGNVFLKGANPSKHDKNPLVKAEFDPALRLIEKPDGWYLEYQFDKAWSTERTRQLVTTELLGKAVIPDLPFENPDGSPLRIDTDYFGKKRNAANPSAGPFETSLTDTHPVKVW